MFVLYNNVVIKVIKSNMLMWLWLWSVCNKVFERKKIVFSAHKNVTLTGCHCDVITGSNK